MSRKIQFRLFKIIILALIVVLGIIAVGDWMPAQTVVEKTVSYAQK